jgi:hypothetical protein
MIVARHEVPGIMRKIALVPAGRLNGARLNTCKARRASRTPLSFHLSPVTLIVVGISFAALFVPGLLVRSIAKRLVSG